MVRVEILDSLKNEIQKKSKDIFRLMSFLEENLKKGKEFRSVGGIVIK